jgi:hypothetical protein
MMLIPTFFYIKDTYFLHRHKRYTIGKYIHDIRYLYKIHTMYIHPKINEYEKFTFATIYFNRSFKFLDHTTYTDIIY